MLRNTVMTPNASGGDSNYPLWKTKRSIGYIFVGKCSFEAIYMLRNS